MKKTARLAGFLALLVVGWPSDAAAAGPGDTLLVSRPGGSAPLTAGLFAWNESGVVQEQGGGVSQNVTADGRYVVFESLADGLAPGEDPGFGHVFRKDMQTGALTVIDAGGNGEATDPDISDDGRYVVFTSRASNLAAADSTHDADVFVKDLQTGAVTLITPSSAGSDCLGCLKPVISGDGSEVAFVTTASLVAGDTNSKTDVYAMTRSGGSTVLVSAKPGGTDASAGSSFEPSITDNGAVVAYLSTGNDLNNTNDPTTDPDLYVRTLAGTSSGLASAQSGNNFGVAAGGVDSGQISGEGTTVAWSDDASYLGADGDTKDDVYRRVLGNNAVDTLVSVNTAGTKGDQPSFFPAIDSSGRRVAFISAATNLGASGGSTNLFVRDTQSSTTTAITDNTSIESPPAITHGNGDRVAFHAFDALSDGPSPEAIHVASVGGGGLALVSQPASGGPLVPQLTSSFSPNFFNTARRVSADGRYVVFPSDAPALGGPAGAQECWRRDLLTDQLLMVSTGPGGPLKYCGSPTLSSDGQRVAFSTGDPLDPADSGNSFDVYVHDIPAGTNTLATRADGATGAPATPGSPGPSEISGDGRKVAFVELANNLGDPAGKVHVYLRNLDAATTELVDRTTAGAIPTTAALDSGVGVDETGDRVALSTGAQLDPALDTDGFPDVYVRDLSASTTTLVSRQSASDGGAKGSLGSLDAIISQDGNHVAFLSAAQNLVPSLAPWPSGPTFELIERDLAAQTTTMVSTSADGASAGDGGVGTFFALDRDGGVAAYEVSNFPTPSNIAPELSGEIPAVIARRVSTHQNLAVLQPTALGGGSLATEGARAPGLSADGRCLSYYARGRDVFPGMSPDFTQLYARVLDGTCQTPQPSGSPTPVASAPVRPALSRVSMTRKRFRVGKKRTPVVAKRKKRAKVGTTFRFTLNVPAAVTIRIDRLTKGKRVKKRCVAPKPKLRKRRTCTRARRKGTLTRRSLAAGARRVAFSGRIGKRKLAAGRYRATLTATAAGVKSQSVKLAFTVVR